MVDFKKLKTQKAKPKSIDPIEIFRRMPKPPGINDLYSSQTEVLKSWFDRREERDIVLKLHTGGGKTLVGLLMAQSTINETGEPVLYLTPTRQLVQQTLEKADDLGIRAVPYQTGEPLADDFVNGKAIMVGTYKALFNGRSKFGIRGSAQPQRVSAVILDDAHAAFSVVRESFTLDVSADDTRYAKLIDLFRKAFKDSDKLGTLEDVMEGTDFSVLEVPFWAWHEQLDAVREQLRSDADQYPLVWPLIRDQLHLCHALISRTSFTVTPILPLVNAFPTFFEAPRRIYMSATIADDSEIIRTFDADLDSLKNALKSRSLAGVSERMILIPDLMSFKWSRDEMNTLLKWTTEKQNLGAVILVSSSKAAEPWADVADIPQNSRDVERIVGELQSKKRMGPVVFANRYDGIDLPGDSCRLLVMNGLPSGTSSYELYRAAALYGGTTITRMVAQRIEQGIGRGARGSGDHCVILLLGADIAAWVAKEANFRFLTSPTKAQLDMGIEISKEVVNLKDLSRTVKLSFERGQDWVEYHAETLAQLTDEEETDESHLSLASTERKAINLWHDGYHEKAIARLERLFLGNKHLDTQTLGWLEQLAARIADQWGNQERGQDLQRLAYGHNRNLMRPKVRPPYRPLSMPGPQSKAIVERIADYRLRQGFLQRFEEVVVSLHRDASANQFEQALADFAKMIGLASERYDVQGEGPDVLWLLPNKQGFVIEAKSRKKDSNPLTKGEHGQLLVAGEWFNQNYPDYHCVRVSVHPKNAATRSAVAGASHALTYERLASMVSDARALLSELCQSQLSPANLEAECDRLLEHSNLKCERIESNYLVPFSVED